MAPRGKSQAERVARWRSLLGNEPELLAEMPHLERDLAILRGMEEEAVELFAEIARLRSRTREAVARMRELTRRGDLLRTRMGASLRGQLGFESPLLIKYGFDPRPERGGSRLRKDLEPRVLANLAARPPDGEAPADGPPPPAAPEPQENAAAD